jgi:hypothetical protein
MTGKNNPCFGRTGENHPMYGKPRSEDFCKNQSEKMSGENNSMYGKKQSEESKRKNREAHLGRKQWVNKSGDRKCQVDCPGPEWQRGRKWNG